MALQGYIKMGLDLGLEGKELQTFAMTQQKEDRLYEEKKAKEQEVAERDERQRKRDHERELKEIELKIAQTKHVESQESTKEVSCDNGSLFPKLPKFNEKVDEIDAYILRFERYATMKGWPNDKWAISLGSLLEGKALEVYSRLPIAKAQDFENVKSNCDGFCFCAGRRLVWEIFPTAL